MYSETSVEAGLQPLSARALRVGFWRRAVSVIVDQFVIGVPIMLLLAALYSASNGRIQGGGLVTFCVFSQTGPSDLLPPPTMRIDVWSQCTSKTFGMTSASWVIGRNVETTDNLIRTRDVVWRLDRNGSTTDAVSLDWTYTVVFFVYLVWMSVRYGRTLGDRLVRIRLIETGHTEFGAISIKSAVLRPVFLVVGLVPSFVGLIFVSSSSNSAALGWVIVAGLASAVVWLLMLLVQIVRRRDPWFDRWAGTAVVYADGRSAPSVVS